MKSLLTITTIFLALVSGIASADEGADQWGKRGVGVGAATGALLAGPPGLIIGAGAGGFIAERMARAKTATDLETDLALAQSDLADLRDSLYRIQQALASVRTDLSDREQRIAELESARRLTVGLETDVHFRTGSSGLEVGSDDRLDRLAGILNQNPDLRLRLDGYADPRGEAETNLALSRDRNGSVRQALIARGVEPNRIVAHAHGDSQARIDAGDMDAYALERRVRIRLESNEAGARVANSD